MATVDSSRFSRPTNTSMETSTAATVREYFISVHYNSSIILLLCFVGAQVYNYTFVLCEDTIIFPFKIGLRMHILQDPLAMCSTKKL